MRGYLKKNKHIWVLSYVLVYFVWFFSLERKTYDHYYVMQSKIDDFIPFNEWFVIPYILWFVYVCSVVLYLFVHSVKDYYKCTAFLFIGMTICLIIYTLVPNMQNLRVTSFEHKNILIHCVKWFYAHDTNTNVCPSIHVYNSIGAHIALTKYQGTKNKKWIIIPSGILMVSICLSTMFIKQHSIIDVAYAVLLAGVMYVLVYHVNYARIKENFPLAKIKQRRYKA